MYARSRGSGRQSLRELQQVIFFYVEFSIFHGKLSKIFAIPTLNGQYNPANRGMDVFPGLTNYVPSKPPMDFGGTELRIFHWECPKSEWVNPLLFPLLTQLFHLLCRHMYHKPSFSFPLSPSGETKFQEFENGWAFSQKNHHLQLQRCRDDQIWILKREVNGERFCYHVWVGQEILTAEKNFQAAPNCAHDWELSL